MDWLTSSLQWYAMLLLLGLIFYPISTRLFGVFIDRGYPFAKTIGILLVSYAIFLLGFIFPPFHLVTLSLVIFGFLIFSAILHRSKSKEKNHINRRLIIFEEFLFLASFLFLAWMRGHEPSIHGLEKFMDFGFMNSILRSNHFPPIDMWLPPRSINYYYFGHLTGSVLIKLSQIKPSIGYNLVLATIFAQGITLTFSFIINLILSLKSRINTIRLTVFGFAGAFIVNLGGNLHAIYLFTKGYPNENPVPFWTILSWFNPTHYWYPNATRFIPFTIHEFPSYSYVVADLHGHVFDIPFVLLTLTLLFVFFTNKKLHNSSPASPAGGFVIRNSILFGFLTAIHYMTNAFDGPIYLLLIFLCYVSLFTFSKRFFLSIGVTIASFIAFSLPFTLTFQPFANGIAMNCAPQFLITLKKIGPFLFEADKCQPSALWMLFVLWGFFLINFVLFALSIFTGKKRETPEQSDFFIFILFFLGTILILIPEFFYVKDIYPAHFRANTMFKLGYQAFIMMGIASTYALFRMSKVKRVVFSLPFFLIVLYPFFSFPSYYSLDSKNKVQLDGIKWLEETYPEDKQIVEYLNTQIKDQPVILEAQGDSYTDHGRISANTGLPTVAGWQVHEWLWRGSHKVVGDRIPDIEAMYESHDVNKTKNLLKKYHVQYIVVSQLERKKYKKLYDDKFRVLGKKIFESSNGFGALYQVK